MTNLFNGLLHPGLFILGILDRMNFHITSTVLFLVVFQCLEEANGESCGTVTYDPDTEYCLTSGSTALSACKVGYCSKNAGCVLESEGGCVETCPIGQIMRGEECYCIGAKTGSNSACIDAPSSHQCASCTAVQVCIGVCLGDIPICDAVVCQNGGTCSGSTIEDYTCACVEGYKGRHCEIEIPKFGC